MSKWHELLNAVKEIIVSNPPTTPLVEVFVRKTGTLLDDDKTYLNDGKGVCVIAPFGAESVGQETMAGHVVYQYPVGVGMVMKSGVDVPREYEVAVDSSLEWRNTVRDALYQTLLASPAVDGQYDVTIDPGQPFYGFGKENPYDIQSLLVTFFARETRQDA